MKVISRITALEKASSKNKTHYISNADCAAMTDFKGCTVESCQYGCWFTEAEYNKHVAENKHRTSEWKY